MTDQLPPETFEEFKNSFLYGSRTDMNIKFLKALSNLVADEFFQGLLLKLGDAGNDGQVEPVINHNYQW